MLTAIYRDVIQLVKKGEHIEDRLINNLSLFNNKYVTYIYFLQRENKPHWI